VKKHKHLFAAEKGFAFTENNVAVDCFPVEVW